MTLHTNSKQGLPQPGLDAAREGRTFCRYVNEKSGLNSATVLSDSTFVTNMEQGKRYIVTCVYIHVGLVSDTVEVEYGVTTLPDGAGDFTAKTLKFELETGAANQNMEPAIIQLPVPFAFTLDDGQCITAKVLTNDAGAEVTVGYMGWEEDD